jgi:hypothetical protein
LEKEAKTFAPLRARYGNDSSKFQKFFGSFFQERTAFFLAGSF